MHTKPNNNNKPHATTNSTNKHSTQTPTATPQTKQTPLPKTHQTISPPSAPEHLLHSHQSTYYTSSALPRHPFICTSTQGTRTPPALPPDYRLLLLSTTNHYSFKPPPVLTIPSPGFNKHPSVRNPDTVHQNTPCTATSLLTTPPQPYPATPSSVPVINNTQLPRKPEHPLHSHQPTDYSSSVSPTTNPPEPHQS